jgi:hypothetical protein
MEDVIKMHLKEVVFTGMDWIHTAEEQIQRLAF